MGGAGAFAAPAPEFIPLELPPLSGPWEVEIPRRGSPAVTRLFTQVKMWAAQSSQHRFRVEARFADGSTRSSAPVTLYVFRPRLDGFPLGLYPDCGG